MENSIQKYYNNQASEEKFLMAIFPEHAQPLYTSDKTWAIGLKMQNVFCFPGTPSLVKDAFPEIEPLLKGNPIFKTKININSRK